MSKIIINGRFLSQRLTGVHRYAYEMTCALMRAGADILVVAPQNICESYKLVFPVKKIGLSSSHFWEQVVLPLYVKTQYKNSLLISFTGLGPIYYKNSFVTIHDMSFMANPKWFTFSYYYFYKLLTPIMASHARKIITVSEFSKNEIIKYLNICNDKIIVIYNAVSEEMIGTKVENNELYILAVSSLDPRKNLNRLVNAYSNLKNKDYKLYIVGTKHPSFRDGGSPKSVNENIKFCGYVGGKDLSNLYANAQFSIYPSLYEGFGLPNLEAMINGCPVLTSNIKPHLEVCQDAALYFNPLSVEDITKTIDLAIENKDILSEIKTNSTVVLNRFSWDKSANKLIKFIEGESKIL